MVDQAMTLTSGRVRLSDFLTGSIPWPTTCAVCGNHAQQEAPAAAFTIKTASQNISFPTCHKCRFDLVLLASIFAAVSLQLAFSLTQLLLSLLGTDISVLAQADLGTALQMGVLVFAMEVPFFVLLYEKLHPVRIVEADETLVLVLKRKSLAEELHLRFVRKPNSYVRMTRDSEATPIKGKLRPVTKLAAGM